MTPFGRWLKRTAEKVLGKYYEGPEAPERLRQVVLDFANRHPGAPRALWVDFAASFAEEAYRTGYVRGFDYTERTNDWRPDVPPEVLADWLDPGWRGARQVDLANPDAVPPLEGPTEDEVMREHVDELIISRARSR